MLEGEPRLAVTAGDGSNTMEFLTRFVADAEPAATIDDYFSKEEQATFAKAEKLLEGIGDVTDVKLVADNQPGAYYGVHFTLAQKSSAAAAVYTGVLTVLVLP